MIISAELKKNTTTAKFGIMFPSGVWMEYSRDSKTIAHPKDKNLRLRIKLKDARFFSRISYPCGCEYIVEWSDPSLFVVKETEVSVWCEEHDPTVPHDED